MQPDCQDNGRLEREMAIILIDNKLEITLERDLFSVAREIAN